MKNCNDNGDYFNPKPDVGHGDETAAAAMQEGTPANLSKLTRLSGNRAGTLAAREQRNRIAHGMINDGLAPWQFQFAFRCK